MIVFNRLKRIYASLLFLFLFNGLYSQVVQLIPDNPSISEPVKIIFNAAEGNKGLIDYEGDVYFHTGLITDKSNDIHSWKHVIGNWGVDDELMKMTTLGNNLYEYEMVIKSFYNVRDEEVIQQIALVFRNADGTIVGKTKADEDIVIPVAGFIPPEIEKDNFSFEKRMFLSYEIDDNVLNINTDRGITQIIAFTDEIIQVRHFSKDELEADSSVAVILEPEEMDIVVKDFPDKLDIHSGSIEIEVIKNPFKIVFLDEDEKVLLAEEKGYYEKLFNRGVRFQIDKGEQYFGLGERAVNLALNGKKYQLYNKAFYGYEIGAKDLNYCVPLFLSSKKYMVFVDNPQKGYVDIGFAEPEVLEFGAIGGTMNYFFIKGENFEAISSNYFKLTGTQPLPPRWAFGNLMSRMAYRSQTETDSIVQLMREKNFPLDAVILDFYWFGDSIKGTMGRLDWYKPNWPDPKRLIDKFREEGVKTILITEPYVLDSLKNFKYLDGNELLAKNEKGESYIDYGFYFGYGGLIDIFKPEARNWFWEQYKKQIDMGVAAWWGDLGEPESHPSDMFHVNGTADEVHNIYGHFWHEMLFEKYKKEYPDVRLFNLNRAGYAGSQRYSIFPWTGDVARSWGGFQAQLPLMLHMSISGLPYIHADAGGFAQGVKDEELYTRWLQFACFSPILRPHGSGVPSEPVFFSEETQNIVRNFMNIRYSLLPYIYTNAWEAATNGDLMIKPLFYKNPNEINAANNKEGYYFGDQIVVFPVFEKGQREKQIQLPDGNWYDLFTQDYYEENIITVRTDLKNIPVFVKSGSFIPTVLPKKNTESYSSDFLIVNYYYDMEVKSSSYTMYEDDGKTNHTWENGSYELITFDYSLNKDIHVFHIENNGGTYTTKPKKRWISLRLIGFDETANKILLNKFLINRYDGLKDIGINENGYFYDNDGVLTIYFEWNYSDITLEILH